VCETNRLTTLPHKKCVTNLIVIHNNKRAKIAKGNDKKLNVYTLNMSLILITSSVYIRHYTRLLSTSIGYKRATFKPRPFLESRTPFRNIFFSCNQMGYFGVRTKWCFFLSGWVNPYRSGESWMEEALII